MRTIKFRGVRLDYGGWIYGSLLFTEGGCSYIFPDEAKLLTGAIQIDENTIGQFTGLTDKNGNDIYEGDIVKPFTDEKHLAQIIFSNRCFKILTKTPDDNYHGWNYFKEEISIVGNIHQNPELITPIH